MQLDFQCLRKPLLDQIDKSDVKQKFEQAIVAKNAEPTLIDIINKLITSV
jgi:hypothetical protein